MNADRYKWRLDQLKNPDGDEDLGTIVTVGDACRDLWMNGRLLVQVPLYAVGAMACIVVSRIATSDGRPLLVLDDPAAALAWVGYGFAALAVFWALRIGAGAYWHLNLVSQLTVLVAFHAVALHLAGRFPLGGVAARVLLAAFVGAVAEIASSAWMVRHAQTERIYRLTQLSRLVGVAAAVAVAFAIVRLFS